MPLLSVSNATVTELFNGSAKFGRPSTNKGAGWVVTADKGNAIIQKQKYQDGTIVLVVRWTNYMDLDGLNGRILPDLPILRQHDSVYFKTSSTTTRGNRHKAPFCFKFEGAEQAEEFEMCWLKLNGSTVSGKEEDVKKTKKAGSSSNNKNLPLQDTTNAASTPLRSPKRKADPMNDGSLRKKAKGPNGSLDKKNDGDENVPLLSPEHSCVVGALKKIMPTGVIINGKLRAIVKVKRSILKSIAEDSNDEGGDHKADCKTNDLKDSSNGGSKIMPTGVIINGKLRAIVKVKRSILKSIAEDSNDEGGDHKADCKTNDLKDSSNGGSNEDSSNDDSSDDEDSSDDDDSKDSNGEDVIIDEEDAPQSQNWMTAFASYE